MTQRITLLVAAALLSLPGCAAASKPAVHSSDAAHPTASTTPPRFVPASLAKACGHPGTHATVSVLPVTIPHQQCDLTGVVLLHDETGLTVPASGEVQANADGPNGASDLSASIDPTSGDVTLR